MRDNTQELDVNKLEQIIADHNKEMRIDMASEITGGTRSKSITDVITVKAILDWHNKQGEAEGKELLDLHWLQLSFYAYILKQYGYTVEGLDVYWLNPNKLVTGENAWEEFSHDVIDISKAL